jgi:inosose dehydratase
MGLGYATIMYDGVALERAFASVSACRYDGIEVGLGKIETVGPDAVADWLDKYDLDLYCVMGHWIESEAAAESLADSAELVSDLGAEFLAVLPPQRHRNEDATVESWLRTVSEAAVDAGITPILHHHGGTHIEQGAEIRAFLDAIDGLELLFDTAHWYPYGDNFPKGDVTDGIERFADDLAYVHLKDVDPIKEFAANRDALSEPKPHLDNVINYFRSFTDLGNGTIDFEGVQEALTGVGYDGHYTIEIEDQISKPLVHAKENFDYWQSLGGPMFENQPAPSD